MSNRIDGLTKLAKLDFFVRYPTFFAAACAAKKLEPPPVTDGVEAPMVRHHYGPWDKRYYHVLAFLEGTALLSVSKKSNGSYRLVLTEQGVERADTLARAPEFISMVAQMRYVKKVFGSKSGSAIKQFIYDLFDREIAQRVRGEVIE